MARIAGSAQHGMDLVRPDASESQIAGRSLVRYRQFADCAYGRTEGTGETIDARATWFYESRTGKWRSGGGPRSVDRAGGLPGAVPSF